MSALPKPDLANLDYGLELQTQPQKAPVTPQPKTTKLSRKKRSSASLQLLQWAQTGSSWLAATVMFGSVGIYLTTVNIPQLWSQEYETLETLQRQERELVAIDEALKYDIAQQAEQAELEMSAIASGKTVFLPQTVIEPQISANSAEERELWQSIPLGY